MGGMSDSEAGTFRTCTEPVIETQKRSRRRANVQVTKGAVPADGEGKFCSGGRVGRVFGFRRRHACLHRNYIHLAFAKTKRRFDCLDDSCTVFLTDRDAILNHLYARTEASNFWIDINSHHLVVDPNTQVPLLLEKIEKCTRCGLWRNGNPKRDENILSGAVLQYLVGNRLRALGADFATTIRAESFREMRPEQF